MSIKAELLHSEDPTVRALYYRFFGTEGDLFSNVRQCSHSIALVEQLCYLGGEEAVKRAHNFTLPQLRERLEHLTVRQKMKNLEGRK